MIIASYRSNQTGRTAEQTETTLTVFEGGLIIAELELTEELSIAATVAMMDAVENTRTAPEAEQAPETVWVPVTGGDEVELTMGDVWEIHRLFSAYRNLKRGREQFAAMRTLRELKAKGYGLAHHEYRDVANWLDSERDRQWRERQGK